MSVSPAMRIFSAISFGVFWRCAPSTSAIMRSRKVSPGLEVMRIVIRSERTFVPPVTALRSPPDSRMTGALSPVITDSSTVAMPSITSPSPGMMSPASARAISPALSCEEDDLLDCSRRRYRLRHRVGLCFTEAVGLSLAARFSHGLREVGKQHREPEPERDLQRESRCLRRPTAKSRMARMSSEPRQPQRRG